MRAAPLFATILLLSACQTAPVPVPVAPPPAPAALQAEDLLAELPRPPVPGSVADKADLAAVFDLQAKRTQRMCDFAQADAEVSLKRFLAPLGLTLNGDTVQTDVLIKRALQLISDAAKVAKANAKRPRPYDVDGRLIPCLGKAPEGSYGYPSSHAAAGYMFAGVLGEMIPEQKAKWLSRAAEFGHSRLVGGLHFPSDIDGGKVLGQQAAARLLQDPASRAQIGLARTELRRALGY